MSVIRLSIDFENPARLWWESGGQELWEGIGEGGADSSVVLDEHLAESWLAEARKVPGWDEGPDHAPHPIQVSTVDEFEVE